MKYEHEISCAERGWTVAHLEPPSSYPSHIIQWGGIEKRSAAAAATSAESAHVDRARAVQQHLCLSPNKSDWF